MLIKAKEAARILGIHEGTFSIYINPLSDAKSTLAIEIRKLKQFDPRNFNSKAIVSLDKKSPHPYYDYDEVIALKNKLNQIKKLPSNRQQER